MADPIVLFEASLTVNVTVPAFTVEPEVTVPERFTDESPYVALAFDGVVVVVAPTVSWSLARLFAAFGSAMPAGSAIVAVFVTLPEAAAATVAVTVIS